MDENTVRRLALVLSVQSEIEGMKAENALRETCKHSPSYGEAAFMDKAEELRNIAYAHRDQL